MVADDPRAGLGDEVQVCLFAKAPVAGRVKTRMQPSLDEQEALQLHIDLLQVSLRQLADTVSAPLVLAGSEPHPFLEAVARRHQVPLYWQRGVDLGERMRAAIVDGLQQHRAVILVGADCPFIDGDYIAGAIAELRAGAPVVFGPARDGGYVLLGASRDIPELFRDMPWGGERVLAVSRQRLADSGLTWSELAMQDDIDYPADLARLAAHADLAHWAGRLDPS